MKTDSNSIASMSLCTAESTEEICLAKRQKGDARQSVLSMEVVRSHSNVGVCSCCGNSDSGVRGQKTEVTAQLRVGLSSDGATVSCDIGQNLSLNSGEIPSRIDFVHEQS